MPRIGPPKETDRPALRGAESIDAGAGRDSELDDLVAHCLSAHAILAKRGTPAMRRLMDLLLFEIGSEVGAGIAERSPSSDLN